MASIDEIIRGYVASWNESDPAKRGLTMRKNMVPRGDLPQRDGRVRRI